MRTLCAEITGQDEEDVPVRWRDNGKYRSITVKLHFKDADTVRGPAHTPARLFPARPQSWAGTPCAGTHAHGRRTQSYAPLAAEQVYAVYAAIDGDPRVKYKL